MSANYRCNLATSKEKYLEKLKERNLGAYEYLMEGINIISRLNEKMFEAYIVGGAVRDILLNKDFNDIDICTTATPNEVMEVFPESDGRYAEMGVVTVKVNDMKFEVTTFRIEEYSGKSRKPLKVHYSRSLTDDIKRRDYTVNALALSATFNVIDITKKGLKDVQHKKVRIIGKGKVRYSEDPIRIFRGLELVSKYRFSVSLGTIYAMKRASKNLLTLSHGRLAEEIIKVFKHKYRNKAFRYFSNYELFKAIPEYNEWMKRMVGVFGKISTIDAFAMLYYMMDKIPANVPFSKAEILEIQGIIKAVKSLENSQVDRLMVFETKYETLLAANYILKNTKKGYKNQVFKIKNYHKHAFIKDRSELNFKTEDLIKLLQGETGPKIGLIMNILIKKVVLGDAKNNFSMLKQEAVKLLLSSESELEDIYHNIGVEEVKVESLEKEEEPKELTVEEQDALRLEKLQDQYNKELKDIYYTLLKYISSYDSLNIEDQKLIEKETLEKAKKTLLDTNPEYLELFEKKGAKKNEKV